MTDNPITYTTLNPVVMLIDGNNQELSPPIPMNIYNEDGSPTAYPDFTTNDLAPVVRAMLKAVEGTEMRKLLAAINMIDALGENACIKTMQVVNQLIHSDMVEHLDHDLMCPGLHAYLEVNEIKPDITAENSQEEVLKRFFTGDTKAN